MIIKPGQYLSTELSNSAYHADRNYLSSSGVKLLLKSPSHFFSRYIAPPGNEPEPTDALIMGSAVHTAILEPDLLTLDYVRAPDVDKRTKEGKAAWAEFEKESKGKQVLTAAQWNTVLAMRDSVYANPLARKVLEQATPELSFFARSEDLGTKARTDALKNMVMVDVKTTDDISPYSFSKSVAEYGYHIQEAHYRDVFQQVTGEALGGFVFLVIEKRWPHPCAIYELDEQALQVGRHEQQNGLDIYKRCRDENSWLDFQPLALPAWKVKQFNLEYLDNGF